MKNMLVVQLVLVIYTRMVIISGRQTEADNCWKLVFRGLSGIGKQVYSAWTEPSPTNCTLDNGCIPDNVDLTVVKPPDDTHLKSPLVEKWETLDISQVKLEFHTNERVMYMVLNGTNSNYTTWFTKNRLLESSFDDLYSDGCLQEFTMDKSFDMKFLVAQESYNCFLPIYWWMGVHEYYYGPLYCHWFGYRDRPVFLYSPKNHKSRLGSMEGYLTADAMSIYIKTANS